MIDERSKRRKRIKEANEAHVDIGFPGGGGEQAASGAVRGSAALTGHSPSVHIQGMFQAAQAGSVTLRSCCSF